MCKEAERGKAVGLDTVASEAYVYGGSKLLFHVYFLICF